VHGLACWNAGRDGGKGQCDNPWISHTDHFGATLRNLCVLGLPVYPITWVEGWSWCPFVFFVLLMFEKGTNMKEKTEDLLNKAWVSHVSTIEVVHVSMFPKQERSIYDPPIRMAFCGRLTLFFCFPIKIAIWWAYWVYCVHFRIFSLKTFLVPSAIFCPIPLVPGEEKRLILWGSAPVSLLGKKPAQ